MSKKQKVEQGRGCIFCGSRPLTEEELFPLWIRKIYKVTGSNKHGQDDIIFYGSPASNAYEISSRNMAGHQSSRKLKVVCKDCNNIWMSQLEEKTIPVLSKLILDEPICLKSVHKSLISKWVILRMILFEYIDDQRKVISQEVRQRFFKHQSLINGFYVWIGRRAEGDIKYHYYKWKTITTRKNELMPQSTNESKPNMLMLNLGIKHVVLHIVYHPYTFRSYRLLNGLNEKMILINPQSGFLFRLFDSQKVDWLKLPSLTKEDLRNLDRNLEYITSDFNSRKAFASQQSK